MNANFRFISLLFLLNLAKLGITQNSIPVVSNLSAVADTSNHKVTLTFDLADTENDSLEVWIQVSADSGKTWRVLIDSTVGDKGFPIMSGTGKSIVWHYQNSTIAQFGNGLTGFKVRVHADDRFSVDMNALFALIDSARIHQDLISIEGVKHRTSGLTKLNEVGDSIFSLMNNQGYHPYRHGNSFGAYTCQNIIGRRSGTRDDSTTYLMSGHYDTVSNAPGADDNGTALVTLKEAIRVLSGIPTKNALRLFAFDLEEAGLIGSAQYVSDGLPSWEKYSGLINMDCIGYFSDQANSQTLPSGFNLLFPQASDSVAADSFRGNFISAIVNTNSSWMNTHFKTIATTYTPALRIIPLEASGTGTLTPDLRRSDHAPFWDAIVPAMFLSDGADFRNPHYHTTHDTIGTIDMPRFLLTCKAAIMSLVSLAQPEHSSSLESNFIAFQLPLQTQTIQNENPKWSVFPNPNSGIFEINLDLETREQVRIEILDHHAHLLQVAFEGAWTSNKTNLKLETALPAGQYFCRLWLKGVPYFQPLVVLR